MVCCHWLFHPSAPVEQPQAEPQQPPAPSVQAPPAVTTSEAGADSLGASFQHARHTLRDVHSFRLGPSELVLRHSVDGGRSALSESTDAGGRKCVNQYVKVRKLAQGSYGKVVLYSCREDGNVYAIKVLSKSHLGRKYVSHGVTALTDAMREVELLLVLDHPNIVRLVEVIDDPGEDRVYVVLEYLARGPVHQEGAPPLDHATAAAAIADVAAALAYCHWQGVAHNDVKPDNMLTGEDGRTRLIDFSVSQLLPAAPAAAAAIDGAASAAGASLAGSARTPGTPAFTAPECCSGGSFDGAAADVWALGISLYTMLTGAPPFMGNTLVETYQRIQSEELPQPPGLEADTPVGHLLARMLDKDPGKRATISEVLEDAWVKQHAGIAQIAPE